MHTRRRESPRLLRELQSSSIFSSVCLLKLEIGMFGSLDYRAAAKDAALVVGVVELCAIGADAGARPEKEFCCEQHAESWREEVDPECVPIAAAEGGAEGACGVH